MRHPGALALVLVCAGACLAKEYSITRSFDEDRGDDGQGGSQGGARGGNGGSVSPPGGEGGENTGTGGTTGGSTSGTGGDETGGSSQGGVSGDAGSGGTAATGGTAGRAVGGRGGMGGTPIAGGGGRGGAGAGGASGAGGMGKGGNGGQGGASGAAGSATGGSGGMPACGACIVHRYNFNGTGTTATDSVGTAHGTIVGGAQTGGVVTLAGGATDQYVSFPAGVLSGLTDVTLEFWVTWTGGTANWQRIFDFGSNDGEAGDQGSTNTSSSYFFFTTRGQATSVSVNCTVATTGLPRVTYTLAGPASEVCVSGGAAFPASSLTQVAVTIQGTTLSLYVNGTSSGTPATLPGTLATVTRTNNWLGRSQFSADQEFAGTISEFRVYSIARSANELAASNAAGPDTPPTQ